MTDILTDEQLREIEARAEAATEGPWCWQADDARHLSLGKEDRGGLDHYFHVLSCWRCKVCAERDSECLWPNKENSDFIAAARTDIPALIATLRAERELRRKAERIREIEHSYCERKHAFCCDCYDKLPENFCWRCEAQRLKKEA